LFVVGLFAGHEATPTVLNRDGTLVTFQLVAMGGQPGLPFPVPQHGTPPGLNVPGKETW